MSKQPPKKVVRKVKSREGTSKPGAPKPDQKAEQSGQKPDQSAPKSSLKAPDQISPTAQKAPDTISMKSGTKDYDQKSIHEPTEKLKVTLSDSAIVKDNVQEVLTRDKGIAEKSKPSRLLPVPTVTLNNGKKMPVAGYGTWLGLDAQNQFLYDDIPKLMDALSHAIDSGYRHIDTAHVYRVEPEIGELLKKKFNEKVVTRDQIFITTKVWQHNHKIPDVEKSVQASLRRLKLDYVDLVLIHWPMAISQEGVDEKIDYVDTWNGMEICQEKGLTKSIGVCNFNLSQLKRLILTCKIKPSVAQIEVNLNLGQNDMVEYCHKSNIKVVAHSPFGTMVPSRNKPESPEPKLNNPVLLSIAKNRNRTVPQVVLRYLFQRGLTTVLRTLTPSRVLENLQLFDFQLDADEVAKIAKFDIGYRTVRPVFYQTFTHYPFEKVDAPTVEIPMSLRRWKNGQKQNID